MDYKSAKFVKERFNITTQTLNNWRKNGTIKYKKINSRKFLYDVSELEETKCQERNVVIYSRVSNTKQKEDLIRQERLLREFVTSNGHIVYKSYKDIGSGMNEERKEFNKLLEDVVSGTIDTVYITYKDRLTRFGYTYIEKLFSLHGTKIVVINATTEEDFQTELTQDLASIIHHFSMKMYSNRRKLLKETKEKLQLNE